jgi:hypothetical protein
MYDIFFISYNELNADKNFNLLKSKCPRAQRIHGVEGIFNAHHLAAKKSFTKMFWVVDGDAVVLDEFNFDYRVSEYDLECVHVWRSKNPVNRLVYGYGGVKLLPKTLTMNMDLSGIDMTTSISKLFKGIEEVSNITEFNTDPFSSWKSGFRECVKLSSKTIDRQVSYETEERLEVWCSIGKDKPFGEYTIQGALDGKAYGESNKDNKEAIKKINDFAWLKNEFEKKYGTTN